MSKNKLKKSLFIAFILLFCIYYILFPAQVLSHLDAGVTKNLPAAGGGWSFLGMRAPATGLVGRE